MYRNNPLTSSVKTFSCVFGSIRGEFVLWTMASSCTSFVLGPVLGTQNRSISRQQDPDPQPHWLLTELSDGAEPCFLMPLLSSYKALLSGCGLLQCWVFTSLNRTLFTAALHCCDSWLLSTQACVLKTEAFRVIATASVFSLHKNLVTWRRVRRFGEGNRGAFCLSKTVTRPN